MALRPGTRLGHYEILSLRGKGGMGEIYRSRDVRLDRTVAIKILPAALASDAEFRRRFEREATAVATLSHPHICTLFDVGEAPDPDNPRAEPMQFLVMEYLEGEGLDEALQRKPMSQDHVLRIAIEIAQALDMAHRTGIVHRDLKPGNIMLTPAGVKLLDFGLAQIRHVSADSASASKTTSAGSLTMEGTILGTPHYMSPEQVEGKDTDARSDLFAFGAIVYEMVTGKKAFDGASLAGVMASIVEREPRPMLQLQPLASPLLDHVVTRCLAKSPNERWQSAGDVMRELMWIAERGSTLTAAPARGDKGRARERLLWLAALAVVGTIAVIVLTRGSPTPTAPAEMRLSIATPPTFDSYSMAISPDGQKVVFVADSEGRGMLWLYYMTSGASEPLRGTDNPQFPFWSPDSRSICFASSGLLKRLDLESGVVRKIANAPLFLGGTWNADGSILFVPQVSARIMRVSDGTGDPTPVTAIDPQTVQSFPHALPDGQHFLYHSAGLTQPGGVYIGKIDGSAGRRLLDTEVPATFLAPNLLIFLRKGTLWGQRFDPASLMIDGEAFQIADKIPTRGFAGATLAPVSASRTGTLVFRSSSSAPLYVTEIALRDRSGKMLDSFKGAALPALNPTLSPDDTKAAMFRGGDIWLLNLQTRSFDRFTFAKGLDFSPVWSPDGSRIVFSSDSMGMLNLFMKNASGAGGEEHLVKTDRPTDPTDWSADGKYLLYRTIDSKRAYDIWALSMSDRKPFPVLATEHEERDAQFSPDGAMIAYQSNETGRFEVWVRPFPFPGTEIKAEDKVQISTGGGTQVRWSRGSHEIFYVAPDGMIVSVPVQIDLKTRALTKGSPAEVFSLGRPLWGGGTALPFYDVTSDGKRVLTILTVPPPTSNPITVLLNLQPPAQTK